MTREELLERIIYECVSMTDIMREYAQDSNERAVYADIVAKYGIELDTEQESEDKS